MRIPIRAYDVKIGETVILTVATEPIASDLVGWLLTRKAVGAILTEGAPSYGPVSASVEAPDVATVRATREVDDDRMAQAFEAVEAQKLEPIAEPIGEIVTL